MISVLMITYNQSNIIERAVLSILNQVTLYDFELVIADDSSVDDTEKIIEKIKSTHPKGYVIVYFRNKYNLGMNANFCKGLNVCRGSFIALCEGDDYWVLDSKLQLQADYLSANQECVAVTTNTAVLSQSGTIRDESSPKKNIVTFSDILLGRKQSTRTASVMFRIKALNISFYCNEGNYYAGDRKLKLCITRNGQIHVLPIVSAVYRIHPGGVWSLTSRSKKRAAIQNDFIETHKYFSMPFLLKLQFVCYHLQKTLPGDLRYARVELIWQTLAALLIYPQKDG